MEGTESSENYACQLLKTLIFEFSTFETSVRGKLILQNEKEGEVKNGFFWSFCKKSNCFSGMKNTYTRKIQRKFEQTKVNIGFPDYIPLQAFAENIRFECYVRSNVLKRNE